MGLPFALAGPVDGNKNETMSRSPPDADARRLLLAALDPDGDEFARLGPVIEPDLPWDWLFERARAHRVLALFAGRLSQYSYRDKLPEDVQERLERVRCEVRRKTAAAILTLKEVAEICNRLSIPFIVLKGSYLAEKVYGDPHLRVFNDVDVLVPAGRVDELGNELLGREFFFYVPPLIQKHARRSLREKLRGSQVVVPADEARRLLRIHHHHFAFGPRDTDPRIPVEVHWHIAPPRLAAFPAERLWTHVTDTVLCGVHVKTLDPEATLLHAAVHATQSPPLAYRLLPLCDFVWIAKQLSGRIRPQALIMLARSWGVERHLICALQAAENVFRFELSGVSDRRRLRRRWSRACFQIAEMDAKLVDGAVPATRLGRFAKRLVRETFWDLAFSRAPRSALETLGTGLRSVGRLVKAPGGHDTAEASG